MRREVLDIKGPAKKISATETQSPARVRKPVRASKTKPQISRTGAAAETEATVTTSPRVIRKWVEDPEVIEQELKRAICETKTHGKRVQPVARPVGEGVYAIIHH